MVCPTRINLPPRYLHRSMDHAQQPPTETSEPLTRSLSGTKVKFQLDAKTVRTLPLTARTGTDTWYSRDDYANFLTEWQNSMELLAGKKRKSSSLTKWIMGQTKSAASLEELQMLQQYEPPVCRKTFVQSILLHQAQCRVKGFQDPDGYSFLSKALSKKDRKLAWQLAAVNAYEVFEESISLHLHPQKEEPSNTMVLFLDYYMDSVHPYLSQPLVLMSKLLLCDCD